MNRTRIAVAGVGYIGRARMAVAQQSSACELSAIVDPSPAAQALASQAGAPLYPTPGELLERDRPDSVILATPNQLHVKHAQTCPTAGVPTLLEKPIAAAYRC
jgi:predicted dehydrogenase